MSLLTAAPETTAEQEPADKSWIKVIGLSLGIPIAIALMLFAFLAPSTASGPHNLPHRHLRPRTSCSRHGRIHEHPGARRF